MIALADVIGSRPKIDLLQMDIQGGEADLIEGCLDLVTRKVGYLVIGTHSREIEGLLFGQLIQAGWRLEIERPALLDLVGIPKAWVDGVQGWRNAHVTPS